MAAVLKTARALTRPRGFESHTLRNCDVSGHRGHPEPTSGFGVFALAGVGGCGSGRAAGGLVVAGGAGGELAEQFAGGGVDDADVAVLGEQQDVGSGVGSADADVVEAAAVAHGDRPGGADDVAADTVVGVGVAVAGGGFGPGLVGGGGGGPVRQRAVWPAGVVVAGEGVQEGLQGG